MGVFFASQKRVLLLLSTLTFSLIINSSAYGQSLSDSDLVSVGLLAILIILILAAVAIAGNSLVSMAAVRSKSDYKTVPSPANDGKEYPLHTFKKGMDISIKGESEPKVIDKHTSRYGIQPINFHNLQPIPKLVLEDGDEVLAGDPLFFDKRFPDVFFVSPVSGEMAGIVRGAKRAITQVMVLADKEIRHRKLNSPDLATVDRETLREFLKKNGGWPLFLQRPYNIIPDVNETPRDIFVSTFDTAPLAGDMEIKIDGRYDAIQKGVEVLQKLTDGKVYFGMDGRENANVPKELLDIEGVEKHFFRGPHPSGNVGFQINAIDPIKKGDVVWTIGVQELITLGNMFLLDIYDATRVINISGHAAVNPQYVRLISGADLGEVVPEEMADEDIRVISGSVLFGTKKGENPFLDFYSSQVTIIPEGNEYEMLGWLIPHTLRPTASPTFPYKLLPNLTYNVDTNTHGERRAFVMTGQYEELLPMDTYPQHLFKAIITHDIDRMEGLGIYELVEEDVALCEFACTSKQPLQAILREGLDFMLNEA